MRLLQNDLRFKHKVSHIITVIILVLKKTLSFSPHLHPHTAYIPMHPKETNHVGGSTLICMYIQEGSIQISIDSNCSAHVSFNPLLIHALLFDSIMVPYMIHTVKESVFISSVHMNKCSEI